MSSGENTFHEQVSLPNASEISGNNHLTTTTLNSSVGIIPQISNKRQMSDNSLSSDNLNETSTNEELGVPIKRVASSKGSTTNGKPRPHICPICTRAFARLEHLKRHERSHTNEKPFQCAACGRCFARRDLVLRHQQKLHASLPTNNRTNVQRKGKTPKLPPKDGEIVRDYLNDNINIVRNNTSAKLPIKHLNEDMPLTADSFNHPTNTTMSDHSMHNSSSISPVSDIANGNNNSNQSNKQIPSSNLAFNMGNQYLDNFSTTQKNQIDIFNSNLLNNGLMNNAIYNSPNSLNGLIFSPNVVSSNGTSTKPDNITPESQNHSSKLNQQQDKNDQQTKDDLMTQQKTDLDELDSDELDSDLEDRFNNYDHPQAMYEHDELQFNNGNNNGGTNPSDLLSSNYRNQRHASFSAAASSSYTGLPDTKIPHNKQMEELEKEAPQQVGFSSPQLTYKPNSELGGYLDLDLLDSLDLNDLGIDFSSFNYMQPSHNYHDGPNADNAKQPDDERQSVASPQEINLQRVLSNPSNGAALQRVLSHPRSGEALQKVLSHPNSDIALQKVLSHPQPNQILEKISKSDNTNWFNEFINAPIETNFPVISNHIGFTDTPDGSDSSAVANNAINAINSNTFFHNTEVSSSNTNDLKQLFRSRQIDLSKHIPHPYQNPAIPGRCSENVRDHIMKKYQLNQQQFPMLDDLNHYLALYEGEFSKYFPFIHIPSLKIDDNLDQIPLMLSMAAIGALYSFHARNSTTLFNFSRFLIHNFMESQIKANQFHDIPLHITQSLVLHMFLGMFHNDHEITKLISRQLSSLVSLIKTTRLDLPLESLLLPPNISADLLSLPESANNVELINSCFKYFILAQSRIRTIHVLHCLTVLYGCLTDSKVELSVDSIESGSPCAFEELWQAKNYDEWLSGLREKNLTISSKFSLIRLSNGPSYKELWRNLQNLSLDEDVGLRAMLSLLFSLNEFIHSESIELEKNEQKSDGVKVTEWRMEQRPYIESLIKIWESSYVRNRGILVPRGQNVHAINNSCVLKLTLPLLSFAKINKCVYISSVLSHVWTRNWEAMNSEVKKLSRDTEALRDSINYSLDIINLWTEIISINNDAEKTSIRTPIFFLTCLFTSTLLISEYLYSTEINAKKYLDESERVDLSTADRVIWLRAEKIFKKIEQNLLPIGSNNQSFSEFLRIQANGALDVDILDDEIARLALEPGDLKPIAEIILSGKLSVRCLSLGVRILADAPVWPVALLFAEALKARAIHINSNSK